MPTGPITNARLLALKARGERIACLTCYDASFARLLEDAGVEVLLVGDSLGMVMQGQGSTLRVTVDEMVYHTSCVSRAAARALVIADMPFMSYATPERALETAARLMGEGGATMVKLEGGAWLAETIKQLTRLGAPVCAHLGLLPQSVHQLGGYRVQGRDPEAAERIRADAFALQEAGASVLVLECVPQALASSIAQALRIPVIGIGAGNGCDGQVLVLQDLLGVTPGGGPRFSKDFVAELDAGAGIRAAVEAYVMAVKSGAFPDEAHWMA